MSTPEPTSAAHHGGEHPHRAAQPPPFRVPKTVSRTKDTTFEGELRFDEELHLGQFQNVHTMSNSETRLIVNAVFERRKAAGKHYRETENMTKMFDYLDMFSRIKKKKTLNKLEALLAEYPQLAYIERSQIANLFPADVEEAKSLIPSLANKVTDEEMQAIIDEMYILRQEDAKKDDDDDEEEDGIKDDDGADDNQ